jgi:hypothetical protein
MYLAGLMLAASLAFAACGSSGVTLPPFLPASTPPSSSGTSPATITLTNADHGRTIRLRPGQELQVRLVTCQHCSGAWSLTHRPDPRVLRLVATKLLAPSRSGAVPRKSRRKQQPGPVLTMLTFRAAAPGRAALRATGPAGSPNVAGPSYRLTVIVSG